MRLINFAYGELIMIGAYALYLLATPPWPLQLLACLLIVDAAAMAMERIAFRPFRGARPRSCWSPRSRSASPCRASPW